MKYNPIIYNFMLKRMKAGLKPYYAKHEIALWAASSKEIYKSLLIEMQGVGDKNPMAMNITTSFVVIALWLASGKKITPDIMSEAMKTAVDIKPFHLFFGMIDMNTKRGIALFGNMMHHYAAWADNHPEDTNTWDFHFDESLHKDGFYYCFHHCPIASFCKDHGYEEINPVLCKIDFTTMAMMHSKLIREHTIAQGDGICDYWTIGDKVKYPQ